VPHASSYRLEVQENITGWISRIDVEVTTTSYSKSIGFGSTQWRWRVTALGNGNYKSSAPSDWQYFRFVIG
jgi:hypothetical protein